MTIRTLLAIAVPGILIGGVALAQSASMPYGKMENMERDRGGMMEGCRGMMGGGGMMGGDGPNSQWRSEPGRR